MKKLFFMFAITALFVFVKPASAATLKDYGDVPLSGGSQSGHFADIWDLTAGDMTISFTYNGNGLVDSAGAHAWSEIGIRAMGNPDFNPTLGTEGAGVWLATDYDWTAGTFAPDPTGAPTLDMDDKLILQKAGGHGEGDYNLPSVPPVPGNNHRFWWDRDGVDPWQNPATANTGGIYSVVITLHANDSTTGTAFMKINDLYQGFETDGNWSTIELTPAGMTFTGDMTKMQVFYGIYGYGATHKVSFNNILVNGNLNIDQDSDGVPNEKDLCSGTTIDGLWDKGWGTNRWQVMDKSGFGWYQNKPAKKGNTIATHGHDMEYTYGCNGHQIIDLLTAELNENSMNGHRKFGLSSSVLDEFHWDMADGTLDGIYLMDEVDVPGTSNIGIVTSYATESGVDYKLEASGTYRFANWGEYGIADAKFNYRDATHGGPAWVDGATWSAPYQYYLQVRTDTGGVNWIESYNATHIYTASFAGDGSPIHFQIIDDAYGDNSGSIHVKIFADL